MFAGTILNCDRNSARDARIRLIVGDFFSISNAASASHRVKHFLKRQARDCSPLFCQTRTSGSRFGAPIFHPQKHFRGDHSLNLERTMNIIRWAKAGVRRRFRSTLAAPDDAPNAPRQQTHPDHRVCADVSVQFGFGPAAAMTYIDYQPDSSLASLSRTLRSIWQQLSAEQRTLPTFQSSDSWHSASSSRRAQVSGGSSVSPVGG